MVLRWLEMPQFSVFERIFQGASRCFVSRCRANCREVLFTWIGRLPREATQEVGLVTAARAGLTAAVGFELFKRGGGDPPAKEK